MCGVASADVPSAAVGGGEALLPAVAIALSVWISLKRPCYYAEASAEIRQ